MAERIWVLWQALSEDNALAAYTTEEAANAARDELNAMPRHQQKAMPSSLGSWTHFMVDALPLNPRTPSEQEIDSGSGDFEVI